MDKNERKGWRLGGLLVVVIVAAIGVAVVQNGGAPAPTTAAAPQPQPTAGNDIVVDEPLPSVQMWDGTYTGPVDAAGDPHGWGNWRRAGGSGVLTGQFSGGNILSGYFNWPGGSGVSLRYTYFGWVAQCTATILDNGFQFKFWDVDGVAPWAMPASYREVCGSPPRDATVFDRTERADATN